MELTGYGCRVTWDGHTLTAEGTNGATQVALRGMDATEGALRLEVGQVAAVEVKDATRLVNGHVALTDQSGRRYVLHYRRKDAAAFGELADAVRQAAQQVHP